jgi:glycosyltransferase involved in cell wall biosynthesis
MTANPAISLGMPVYNAQRYLAGAIQSVIDQTFEDWELIISDNASTDSTPAICSEFAERDPRIRFHRQERNVGAGRNHNFVAQQARAEYFKWTCYDDLITPEFLERTKAVLDEDDSVVLCHSLTRIIDEDGHDVADFGLRLRTDSQDVLTRFWDLIYYNHPCYQIYGLMRTSVLRECGYLGLYVNGDRVLLARLALYGRFHEIPSFLYFNRRHGAQSTQTTPAGLRKSYRLLSPRFRTLPRLEWWDPDRKGDFDLPEVNLVKEYARCVGQAPLDGWQKWKCRSLLLPVAVKRSPRLCHDFLDAGNYLKTAARARFTV